MTERQARRRIRAAERRSLRIVLRRLERAVGWWRLPGLLAEVVAADDPFVGLGRPASAEERLSRRQMRRAVTLYRALRRRDVSDALEAVTDVAVAVGTEFLRLAIPSRDELEQRLDQVTPEEMATEILERFFNAAGRIRHADASRLRVDIVRCRFVELCAALDVSELAPAFCASDLAFFRRPEAPLRLERTTTLAQDGAVCDFDFRRT